jgi:hypothetical protein
MFKKWLYYFLTEEGKSYYVQNKVVKTSGIPKPLEQTPDGWQDISLAYERDLKKLGIVRSFTLPLSAVYAIRQILRTIVFTKNIEEKIFLLIQKLYVTTTSTTYRFLYNYFYKGEIDLSQYRYEDVTDKFSVVEGGIYGQVKANEGTPYELDIDNDPEVVRVKMDGFSFDQSANWVLPKTQMTTGASDIAALAFINLEGTSTGSIFATSQTPGAADQYFLKNIGEEAVTITLNGSVSFRPNNVIQEVHVILIKVDANNISTNVQSTVYDPAEENVLYTETYDDLAITLNQNEYLELLVRVIRQPGGAPPFTDGYVNLEETKFRATFETTYRTTYINSLKPSTVLKRLIKFITGSENNYLTTYVEGFDHLLLTSGDAIRGLAGAKLKTTLNNFTEFMRVNAGAGQGIENNKLLFEAYSYFLNPDNPIELGEASNLKVYPATDLMGNTLKIGYPVQQIDDVNGKSSFNNTHVYSSPITKVVKEINLVCPYISDAYYIEITRINLEGKTTTDDKADNEVFILNTIIEQEGVNALFGEFLGIYYITIPSRSDLVDYFSAGSVFTISGTNEGTYKSTGAITSGSDLLVFIDTVFQTTDSDQHDVDIVFGTRLLRRVEYDQITGVPDTEFIFNIEDLTPKRLVLLQANWLNSIFYGFAGKKLTFQSTEKNADLVTQRGSVYIRERADYTIGTDILFKPWYFEFDTQVPVDLVELLETNINRCFSFVWYGYTYKGFLVKAGISANDNKVQSYKLLCTPDTDLTNLILTHG